MPARDKLHDVVRAALLKDGWTITHDPLRLTYGAKDMYIDLGAERLLGAEKGSQKIAVEIKGFAGSSGMADLEQAVGQYVVYRTVLAEREPERELFLAIPELVLHDVFEEPLGELLIERNALKMLCFDPQLERIVTWIP